MGKEGVQMRPMSGLEEEGQHTTVYLEIVVQQCATDITL